MLKTGYVSPWQSQTFKIMSTFLLIIFLFSSTFNAEAKNVCVASHNLHGFKTSSNYHKSCLEKYGGLWMGQEHWLTNKQLSQLNQLNATFIARSGMEEAVSSGVLRGRPFGGVSIAWSRDLNHVIIPLTNYKHKRVVAVEMTTTTENIIFICAYMPFLDSRKRDLCRTETFETISMIESIIADHPNHLFIVGGDFNCEFNGNSPFDDLWDNFVTTNRFAYCDNLFTSPGYTYHHESLGQKKFNDHFLVSQQIFDNSLCFDHKVLEDGHNPSDHLPIQMTMRLEIRPRDLTENSSASVPTLCWSKISPSDISQYNNSLSESLSSSESVLNSMSCYGSAHCEAGECKVAIQNEYDRLVNSIKLADSFLPRHRKGREKHWWSSELSDLKKQSIDIQRLWQAEGRPNQGSTYHERLRVRAAYRLAIRQAQKEPKQNSWNQLHTALESCDSNRFWHSWKSLYNKNNHSYSSIVDGCTSKPAIAESFKCAFKRNSEPNNQSKVNDLNTRFASRYSDFCSQHQSECKCGSYHITLENVIDAICSIKTGKCADESGLSAEHFHNAPLALLHRLTALFNQMLIHAFVPTDFRLGFMIPIVKDSKGSHSDVSNYRGITISPVISKIFEHVLKIVFSEHLVTSAYQFGFKKNKSTSHALHCFRETIDYYIENGSRVYTSFLDASKAFDRLVHSGLFIKLMDRNIPKSLLDIIITWHDGLMCRVRWDGVFSDWFSISAGVRQGGVLSPDFYNIYVDELISILQQAGVGCHFHQIFAAAIFYADDIAVLAPSVKALQLLLDLCHTYCIEWDILLNATKTKNMMFGKGTKPSFLVKIDGSDIPWVDKWKYLGVTLQSGRSFGCCAKEKLKSFYRALNSILRIEGRSDELVRLQLLEAHCLPILTYGIEIFHIADRNDRRQLRVAYNSIFRNLFHFSYNESVTALQHGLNRPTWEELLEKRKRNFYQMCLKCYDSPLIRALASLST